MTCIDNELFSLENELKALEAEKETEEKKRQILSKNMESNYLAYRKKIRYFLGKGVAPEKICELFKKCGIPVDQARVENCLEDVVPSTADRFGHVFYSIVTPIVIVAVSITACMYAPPPLQLIVPLALFIFWFLSKKA